MKNLVKETNQLYQELCKNQKKYDRITHVVINNNLYRLYLPLNDKDPELILENVVSYYSGSEDDIVLFTDGTVTHVQSDKSIKLDDAFKVDFHDNYSDEKTVLIVGRYSLTLWNIKTDTVLTVPHDGYITDGYILDNDKTLMIISNGDIYVGGINATKKMKMSLRGHCVERLDYSIYIFTDGFLYNSTYFDIGCEPQKVVCMPGFAVALVHGELFAFVSDGKMIGATYFEYDNEIYDIYACEGIHGLLVYEEDGLSLVGINLSNYQTKEQNIA